MKFVGALILSVATCVQVFGYPADASIIHRISNDISDSGLRDFKFPTAIKDRFEIKTKGVLNMEHDLLSVSLPGNGDYCKITHDFKDNIIRAKPSPSDTKEEKDYDIGQKSDYANKEVNFELTLKAIKPRYEDSKDILEVTYQINNFDALIDLRCFVNFDDLGYIQFDKGVREIKSIQFTFSDD